MTELGQGVDIQLEHFSVLLSTEFQKFTPLAEAVRRQYFIARESVNTGSIVEESVASESPIFNIELLRQM